MVVPESAERLAVQKASLVEVLGSPEMEALETNPAQGGTPMNLLQKLCGLLTRHRFRRCYAYSKEYREYYYSCRICHKHFWNRQVPKVLPKPPKEA